PTSPVFPHPFALLTRLPPRSTLFPYTTLFRSERGHGRSLLMLASWYDHNRDAERAKSYLRRALQTGDPIVHYEFAGMLDQMLLQDRKSTRLNSSHVKISYAVFCLKKKNNIKKL